MCCFKLNVNECHAPSKNGRVLTYRVVSSIVNIDQWVSDWCLTLNEWYFNYSEIIPSVKWWWCPLYTRPTR
jgi:hypothetical protein